MRIKVSLVEDHQQVASELQRSISDVDGLVWLASYSSAEQALREIPANAPDILLVDLRLPGIGGVELIQKLRSVCPTVQCVVLTMYSETDLIFEALKSGACGYLLKRTKPAEIADAIKQVHNGGSVMTPKIARRVLETFATSNLATVPQPEDHNLTERERRVLQFMVEGQPRKQIAEVLEINTHTLDYVIRCIYRKLHVRSLAGAVSVAVREGIISRKAAL